MTKKEQIDLLIKDKKYLISSRLYNRNVNQVKNILELPCWQDEKYHHLLTSNIWLSTPENVIQILELLYWKEKKFQKLLTSNIWKLTKDEVDVIFKISLLHNTCLLLVFLM